MNTLLRAPVPNTPLNMLFRFCLEQKFIVILVTVFMILWGVYVAPFDWDLGAFPRDPVAVDAIPDIGENQQIVFTEWMGRSAQDIEAQITYPLTSSLLGVPGVKTVRSLSMFGFSSIYIIFDEKYEFYWTRSRILEKLNSLPSGLLPEGVIPALGPDATALGQIFWYSLEGRDEEGNPTGGWDLQELRTIQDFYVRYSLTSAFGVSEIASIGGYEKEYQIDADPDAMRAHGVTLPQIFEAIKFSNIDVGARTLEINGVEYIIRGLGFIKKISDIENAVVKVNENVPIYVKNVATVSTGPAFRSGILDKEGAEIVGGVVVARHGSNPLEVIKNVKKKIEEITSGLPKKTVNGKVSQVQIVPFYDRTQLIYETLGTLNASIIEEVIITVTVILIMALHFRTAILVSMVVPIAVLMTFIAMKLFHVEANIVALSGIAIAIGTVDDMGIILCDNITTHLEAASPEESTLEVILRATSEVGSALLTALATTVACFLPVFAMSGAEGKLFRPLAYTKTFALMSSLIIALTLIPPMAHLLFTFKLKGNKFTLFFQILLTLSGFFLGFWFFWAGSLLCVIGIYLGIEKKLPIWVHQGAGYVMTGISVFILNYILSEHWLPLGADRGTIPNFLFVISLVLGLISFFIFFQKTYPTLLRFCLTYKFLFLMLPILVNVLSFSIWLGFGKVFSFVPETLRTNAIWRTLYHQFPGLKKEFMPPLDEGSYLLMPTVMPHASNAETLDILQKMDMSLKDIPEVELVVGKAGRVESALDPAPINMYETIINYKPEYSTDKNGYRLYFKYEEDKKDFVRDDKNELIPDPDGKPYRNWRPHIKTPEDIWKEIVKASQIPGATSAPKLQPISTRLIMLQTGIRAPMAVKIKGADLKTIETVGFQIEKYLKEVQGVATNAVIADRIIGGPYLEIHIDRNAIARYGINIGQVQDIIEVAIGGIRVTTTVEGRERYGVRVRYQRELRDSIESLSNILIPASDQIQIPLSQLAEIRYVPGPKMIKSEDTFLVGYVLFDKRDEFGEVEVVESSAVYLKNQEEIFFRALNDAAKKANEEQHKLTEAEIDSLPGLNLRGCSYVFSGNYENQVRSEKTLKIIIPISIFLMFFLLYLEFPSLIQVCIIFCGISTAWCGGFFMIWLYGQDWFMNFTLAGIDMRELFQIHPFHMSVAVWVGFLALFGISEDDGVLMTAYLNQTFAQKKMKTIQDIRDTVLQGAIRRIRPCLRTVATTVIALVPVLTSHGRGSDVVLPMAIPSFGGMILAVMTVFIVPTLYCLVEEIKFHFRTKFPKKEEVIQEKEV
ncbi:MAG: efflux RND transporter permease subunit [Planctomycetota bacterium]